MRLRLVLPVFLPVLALLAIAAPAQAGKKAVPCWKLVLQDSYSGHFDTIYAHSCYTQAIGRIPTTLLIYSNTREEIQAAASAALNHKKYTSPDATGSGGSGTGTSATPATSSGSHGVPTAIIVLGGVAAALLLVGGAGELWRRTRRDGSDGAS